MRILALSPHPDDIELNAGGFLMKHRNDKIYTVYFSDCEESLGGLDKHTLFLESGVAGDMFSNRVNRITYKVRRFNEVRQSILELLIDIKKELNIDLVLIPSSSDIHQDHQVIYNEAIRAFPNTNVLAYGSPKNCRSFNPNYFETLTDSQVEDKMKLIRCYKSQIKLRPQYFNEDSIKATLKFWGGHIGVEYAEAFEVITLINKL